MISIVAVRPNIDNNFLSWKYNHDHFEDVSENGYSADPNYLESELPFLYEDIKNSQNHLSHFLKRGHPAYHCKAPIRRLDTPRVAKGASLGEGKIISRQRIRINKTK
jgi:hypothetical protein